MICCVIGAIASLFTGSKKMKVESVDGTAAESRKPAESLGEELAAVCADEAVVVGAGHRP